MPQSGGGGIEWMIVAVLAAGGALGMAWLWRKARMPRQAEAVAPIPLVGWIVLAAGVWLAGQVLATIVAIGVRPGFPPTLREQALISGGVFAGGSVAAVLAWRFIARRAPDAGFRLGARDLGLGLAWLACAVPWILIAGFLADLTHRSLAGSEPERVAHAILRTILDNAHSPWAWVLIVGAAIGAPIVEETIYRGLLQSAFVRAGASGWAAALVGAIVFASMHMIGVEPVPWYAVVRIGALGLACGLAFERTRSIGVPIVMHAGFNAANLALAFATAAPVGAEETGP